MKPSSLTTGGAASASAIPSTHGLVDVHTHAVAPALPELQDRYPWDRWPSIRRWSETEADIVVGGSRYRAIDDRCWSADRRIADMDADGVAIQLLSAIPATFCYDAPAAGAAVLAASQNDYFAYMAAQAPDRFRVLGTVPLQDVEAAEAELVRCCTELGFVGIEIGTHVGDLELSDPSFDSFFTTAAALGALVLVHPVDSSVSPRIAHSGNAFGVGMPTETGIAAADLLTSSALQQRPNLRICLAHGAGTLPVLLPRIDRGALLASPDLDRSSLPSALARNLFCDSLTYDRAGLELAVARFGLEHVVLGTDYPFAAMSTPAGLALADLPDDWRISIGRENAMKLFAPERYST